ncbi:hypothetical protein [Haloplanus salilacus]|uniref:hypothetical protein n=1 Tax=Haloplanus salilacus TaxID=2949994 RepID=UPI0030CAC1EB
MMGVSLQPLQAGTAIAPIAEYWTYAVGFLVFGMLMYWTFDERDQTESIAETVEAVGERSRTATGGLVGALGSLVVVIVSIGITIGQELVMSLNEIAPFIMEAPAITGQIIIAGLALLNLEGYVPLEPWQAGTIFLGIVLVTSLWKYTSVLEQERGSSVL